MRRTEELQNRRHILFQQLEMISLYKEDFVKELGESGLKSKIDEILDEINFCSKEIVKFETQKDKDE